MTSSPPTELQHFGGDKLHLESPLPIHIPEAAGIPVLQNQIDPVFNLTSTHIQKPVMASNTNTTESVAAGQSIFTLETDASSAAAQGEETNLTDFQRNNEIDGEGDDTSEDLYENDEMAAEDAQKEDDTLQTHFIFSADHPPAPTTALEPPSTLQPDDAALHSSLVKNPPEESFPRTAQPQEPSQLAPFTNGQTSVEASQHDDGQAQASDASVSNEGVNYDTLLDSLSPSISTAPNAENIASLTTAAPSDSSKIPRPSSADQPLSALPVPAGLPPRPPPQEKPAIHPNYNADNDISTYHFPQSQTSTAPSALLSPSSNSQHPIQGFSHATAKVVGANGLPPPPLATFQQPTSHAGASQASPNTPGARQPDGANEARSACPVDDSEDEAPFSPETGRLWDEFVREEAVYVSEGMWDRFPPGSRLFVGNLFTEKATKRDLFYKFHRYGKLAQISIKNAYGFIQYHDAVCCQRALEIEQGEAIRGRKMHLEISKPQKNTRNAAPTAAGDSLRAGYNKRQRSPDHGRGAQRGGQRNGADRYDRGVPPSGNRGDLRRRDDYRPVRSSSPRGYRGRDEYRGPRGRSPDRFFGGRRSRSRSPHYGRNGRYRSRSPLDRDMDDEASLPFPRRDIRDVPDVQLILVDQVDRTFVGYIEKSFRDRGLRCDVLQLPRVSMAAVVKRQILEGVQAVVKILRQSQLSGKIPLQVFDRRGGRDNVSFEEYEQLDANIAAELVVRAKGTHMAPPQHAPPAYPPAPQYGQYSQQIPPHQPPQQQVPPAANATIQNLITSMDGPALQKLLGTLAQQTPQAPQHSQHSYQQPQQHQQQPDLTALLNSVTRQQPSQQGYPYGQQQPSQQQPLQQQQYNAQAVNQAFQNNPALASLLGNATNRAPQQPTPHQQQQFQPGEQNVQSIMDQLSRFRQ